MQAGTPNIEILAPAGDEEMMRAAVFSGADCVYLGIQGFNARRGAGNFDDNTLKNAVSFCHARGCRVYAALNTLVFPGREAAFGRALRAVGEAGCDAAIVQDLAAVNLARECAPGLPLHASTQMSVHSLAGVRQLAQWGFSRAILARELRAEEIAEIAKHSPIELEVFVHGALCLAVSGQCYFSAFLGGRSGNRGGCAGPCRLPFRCVEGEAERAPASAGRHELSLRDFSILRELPRLAAMGVVSAKIEGRLRGPEYCAAVVDAARKARAGEPYDEDFLRALFCRGDFTGGWYAGADGREMFGWRGAADSVQTKKALPQARALYRREAPRLPVQMGLRLNDGGGRLWVSDGSLCVEKTFSEALSPAENHPEPALRKALEKTGGTPFYLAQPEDAEVVTNGFYAPVPQVSGLRRAALEELLALRGQKGEPKTAEASPGYEGTACRLPEEQWCGLSGLFAKGAGGSRKVTGLRARFPALASMPPEAADFCKELLLPLDEAPRVPEGLRGKTRLCLPRFLAGEAEDRAAGQIRRAAEQGFLGFEAGNVAHLALCRGLPVMGAFGLNVTNALAAVQLAGQGCTGLTLSFELGLPQMRQLAAAEMLEGVRLDALAYGHLPLVLTRACPFKKNERETAGANAGRICGGCAKSGALTDRKAQRFEMDCREGMRTLYNPVPLWMGDRLTELPTDTATLYFTKETPAEARTVLRDFAGGRPCLGPFTRGLYDRGTEE